MPKKLDLTWLTAIALAAAGLMGLGGCSTAADIGMGVAVFFWLNSEA